MWSAYDRLLEILKFRKLPVCYSMVLLSVLCKWIVYKANKIKQGTSKSMYRTWHHRNTKHYPLMASDGADTKFSSRQKSPLQRTCGHDRTWGLAWSLKDHLQRFHWLKSIRYCLDSCVRLVFRALITETVFTSTINKEGGEKTNLIITAQ
jgi:hypothetical protein